MPYYSAHLHLSTAVLAPMLAFAVLCVAFGLMLDVLSLSIWRRRANRPEGRVVGLPLVPWMLYALSSFIWFLRGNVLIGVIQLAVLTVWHLCIHVTIARSARSTEPRRAERSEGALRR